MQAAGRAVVPRQRARAITLAARLTRFCCIICLRATRVRRRPRERHAVSSLAWAAPGPRLYILPSPRARGEEYVCVRARVVLAHVAAPCGPHRHNKHRRPTARVMKNAQHRKSTAFPSSGHISFGRHTLKIQAQTAARTTQRATRTHTFFGVRFQSIHR